MNFDLFEQHSNESQTAAPDLGHIEREELERLYLLALERAAVAESRIAEAELRAAKAEHELETINRARAAAKRRRAERLSGQESFAI